MTQHWNLLRLFSSAPKENQDTDGGREQTDGSGHKPLDGIPSVLFSDMVAVLLFFDDTSIDFVFDNVDDAGHKKESNDLEQLPKGLLLQPIRCCINRRGLLLKGLLYFSPDGRPQRIKGDGCEHRVPPESLKQVTRAKSTGINA